MFPGVVSRAVKHGAIGLTLAFVCSRWLSAMESQPVRVVDVPSALRLTIEATIGGLPANVPLQLDGVRLIGPADHALTKLKELCPPGSQILIEVMEPRVATDAFGLARAWVLCDYETPVDPASSIPPITPGKGHRASLQVELMRSGWAILDDSQPAHRLPQHLLMQARKAMEEARTRKMGAYSLPGFQLSAAPRPHGRDASDGRFETVPDQVADHPAAVADPPPTPTANAGGF